MGEAVNCVEIKMMRAGGGGEQLRYPHDALFAGMVFFTVSPNGTLEQKRTTWHSLCVLYTLYWVYSRKNAISNDSPN